MNRVRITSIGIFMCIWVCGCPTPEIPSSFYLSQEESSDVSESADDEIASSTTSSEGDESGTLPSDGDDNPPGGKDASAPDVEDSGENSSDAGQDTEVADVEGPESDGDTSTESGDDTLAETDGDTSSESSEDGTSDGEIESGDDVESDGSSGCLTSEECQLPDTGSCVLWDCIDGECQANNLPEGEACPVPEEMSGTCATASCNGEGACLVETFAPGTSCAPQNASICAEYACSGAGACEVTPVNEGASCGDDNTCQLSYCEVGECVPAPLLCEDNAGCTLDQCRRISCTSQNLEECTYELRVNDPDNVQESLSFVVDFSCKKPFPANKVDVNGSLGSCYGKCGGNSGGTNPCFCDSVCATAGDCCWDVCEACGEEVDCADYDCVIDLCDPALVNLPDADNAGCISRKLTESEVLQGHNANSDALECAHENRLNVCDDMNSCTLNSCAPNQEGADPVTGCVEQTLEVGQSCTGTELCLQGASATCEEVGLFDGGGVVCKKETIIGGDNSSADPCAVDGACVVGICNGEKGICEYEPSWAPGDEVPACKTATIGDWGKITGASGGCGVGQCAACENGDPGCNGAVCVPAAIDGVDCTPAAFPEGFTEKSEMCTFVSAKGNAFDPPAHCGRQNGSNAYECQVPCDGWNSQCFNCFWKVGAVNCADTFRDEFFLPACSVNKVPITSKEEAEKFLLAEGLWPDIISNCLWKVFPSHVDPGQLENTVKPESESVFKACITPLLADSSTYQKMFTSQKTAFINALTESVFNVITAGIFGSCVAPFDNCADLDYADGLGPAVCAQDVPGPMSARTRLFFPDPVLEPSLAYGSFICIRPCELGGASETGGVCALSKGFMSCVETDLALDPPN